MDQRTMTPDEVVQRMDAARRNHSELEKRVAALKGQADAAKAQLAELAAETERDYQTSDLESLRALYQTWMAENVQALQAFEASLATLNGQVVALEASVRQPAGN